MPLNKNKFVYKIDALLQYTDPESVFYFTLRHSEDSGGSSDKCDIILEVSISQTFSGNKIARKSVGIIILSFIVSLMHEFHKHVSILYSYSNDSEEKC